MTLTRSLRKAAFLSLVLAVACTTPWSREPVGTEVNLAFTLQGNLIALPSVRIGNKPGRYILGTAAPRTVVDEGFGRPGRRRLLNLGERHAVNVTPAEVPLGAVADAIIGADAWQNHAITIDYRSGLVTWQKDGIKPGLMQIYHYSVEPTIEINVDGRTIAAVVDTANPDTLILPSRTPRRGTAAVTIAGTDFGTVDVAYADVERARLGNRLLSRFLVSIDYGRRLVGLWRDPRIPLREPSA